MFGLTDMTNDLTISRRMMNGEEFGSFLSQAAVVMLGALKSIAYQSTDTAHFHVWDQEASSCWRVENRLFKTQTFKNRFENKSNDLLDWYNI